MLSHRRAWGRATLELAGASSPWRTRTPLSRPCGRCRRDEADQTDWPHSCVTPDRE
jgi:hypothetical protein